MYTIYQRGSELHVADPCCTISFLPACFLWLLTSLGNVNGSFSSSETLRILQHGERLTMRCCRQTKLGEVLWGLVWGIENGRGEGFMTSLQYLFIECMGPNFSEELYVKIPHTARDQIHVPQIFRKKTSLFLHILQSADKSLARPTSLFPFRSG